MSRGAGVSSFPLSVFSELWKKNPQITARELDRELKEKGFEIGKTTRATWLARFKKGVGVRTYDGKNLTGVKPRHVVKPGEPTAVKPSKLTLEQIIKATGSVEALSLLFYQGVMEELKRRDSAYDVLKQDCLGKDEIISRLKHELREMTGERNRLIREFNEKLAKVKVGTLTLDQVEHRLIPKKK